MSYDGLDRRMWTFFNKRRTTYLRFDGRSATVGATAVTVWFYDSAGKVAYCSGTSVPADAGAGFAKGCIFIKTNAAGGTRGFYVNKGTNASCQFELGVAAVPGDITLAEGNIIRGNVGGVGAAYNAKTNAQILIGDGTTLNSVAVTGDISIDNTGLTAIGVGVIMNADVNANALIALSKLATQAANTIVMNATGGVAVPTAVALSANSLLYRGAGNISELAIAENRVAGRQAGGALGSVQVTGDMIAADAAIDLTQLATQAANTILANATAGVAVPTAVAVGSNEAVIRAAGNITPTAVAEARVLGRVTGGALGAIQILNEHVDANALIALSKLATQAANTIVANATGGAAVPTAVSVSAQSVLLRAAGNLADTTIAENRVIGRLTGGNLGAVQITAAEIAAAAAIALTQLASQAANTVVANATAGAATPTAVAVSAQSILLRAAGDLADTTIAENRVLGRLTGGNLGAIQITAAEIDAAAAIALTQLATQAANTACANATAGVAVPTAVAIADNRLLGRSGGNIADVQVDSAHCVAGFLDPEHSRILTKSTNDVDDNIIVLAATLLQGYLQKIAGPTAGRNVTTDSAANIQAAFVATVGAYFDWVFANSSGQIMTLIGGAGVTLIGTAAVPAAEVVKVRFINTGAGAVDATVFKG